MGYVITRLVTWFAFEAESHLRVSLFPSTHLLQYATKGVGVSVVLKANFVTDCFIATGKNVLEAFRGSLWLISLMVWIAGDKSSDPNKDDEKIQGTSLSDHRSFLTDPRKQPSTRVISRF